MTIHFFKTVQTLSQHTSGRRTNFFKCLENIHTFLTQKGRLGACLVSIAGEAFCSHHRYSNPLTACSMSWVCITSIYVFVCAVAIVWVWVPTCSVYIHMRKSAPGLFRVDLHVCVTSLCFGVMLGNSVDPFHRWGKDRCGPVKKTASLFVPLCLSLPDMLCWDCRWTTFDLLWYSTSGDKGYWVRQADCHIFNPWDAILKRYVIKW